MKKLIVFSVFCLIGWIGFAQAITTVNVGNATTGPLTVGVEYRMADCSSTGSAMMNIAPGASFLFVAPPGMFIMRVGAMGGPGMGSTLVPCDPCPPLPPAGPYTFDWSADCSHVKIIL